LVRFVSGVTTIPWDSEIFDPHRVTAPPLPRWRSVASACCFASRCARSAVLSADTRRLRAAALQRSLPLAHHPPPASPCRREVAKGAACPYLLATWTWRSRRTFAATLAGARQLLRHARLLRIYDPSRFAKGVHSFHSCLASLDGADIVSLQGRGILQAHHACRTQYAVSITPHVLFGVMITASW